MLNFCKCFSSILRLYFLCHWFCGSWKSIRFCSFLFCKVTLFDLLRVSFLWFCIFCISSVDILQNLKISFYLTWSPLWHEILWHFWESLLKMFNKCSDSKKISKVCAWLNLNLSSHELFIFCIWMYSAVTKLSIHYCVYIFDDYAVLYIIYIYNFYSTNLVSYKDIHVSIYIQNETK